MRLVAPCPRCGRVNDSHTSVLDPGKQPSAGAVGICWGCHGINVYVTDLQLRIPTKEEEAGMRADPAIRIALGLLAAGFLGNPYDLALFTKTQLLQIGTER